MFFLKTLIALAVALALQGLVPRFFAPASYVDLALILTVYFALMRDPLLGMFIGYVAGLGGDLAPANGAVLGVGGFSKTIIGFLVSVVGVRIPLQGPFTRMLVLAVASLLNSILYIALHALLDQDVGETITGGGLALRVGFETAANVLVGVFIFWIFDRLFPENAPQGQMRVRRRFYD